MKKLLVVTLMIMAFQLLGCGTNVKPQPSAPIVEGAVSLPTPEAIPPATPSEPVAIAPPPTAPQNQTPLPARTSNAVVSLVEQARAEYQAKNYQASIAIAERGLRIDRRAPELYLVLAQNYVKLTNTPLAQQFLQQGIRYAQVGSEVAQKLLKIKDTLPH